MYYVRTYVCKSNCSCTKGWQQNFVPKKIWGIDTERFLLVREKNCSFRGVPTEESILKLGTEGNGMKKINFTKNTAAANRIGSMFSSETCFGTEFRFLFRVMVWNSIPSVCFVKDASVVVSRVAAAVV